MTPMTSGSQNATNLQGRSTGSRLMNIFVNHLKIWCCALFVFKFEIGKYLEMYFLLWSEVFKWLFNPPTHPSIFQKHIICCTKTNLSYLSVHLENCLVHFFLVSIIYWSSNYRTHSIHYKFEICLADTHWVALSYML